MCIEFNIFEVKVYIIFLGTVSRNGGRDVTYLLINSDQSYPYLICCTLGICFIGKDCIFKIKTAGAKKIFKTNSHRVQDSIHHNFAIVKRNPSLHHGGTFSQSGLSRLTP